MDIKSETVVRSADIFSGSELKRIENEQRLLAETRLRVGAIRIFLKSVTQIGESNEEHKLSPQLHNTFNEAFSKIVWPFLPESVVHLDFGDMKISRKNTLLEEEQVTWNFRQIEDYGRELSRRIRENWIPIIAE